MLKYIIHSFIVHTTNVLESTSFMILISKHSKSFYPELAVASQDSTYCRYCNPSDLAILKTWWSLYHTESKSKVTAKLLCSVCPTSSAQPALPGFSGRPGWVELVGQTEQSDLALTLDFYSVWYREYHQVLKTAKSEHFYFGMTVPRL